MAAPKTIVLALAPENIRRFIPGIVALDLPQFTYRQIDPHHEPKELVHLLRLWKPEGIIAEQPHLLAAPLRRLNLPTIWAPVDYEKKGATSIDVDDQAVGSLAAEYFLRHGFHHFAFYGQDAQYAQQRLQGYTQALYAQGYSSTSFLLPADTSTTYSEYWTPNGDEVIRWLKRLPKPVAVFAAHDPDGRALIECAQAADLRIPQDVAILGVNNDELVCDMCTPGLSSIRIPWSGISQKVIIRLAEWIEQGAHTASSEVIPPTGVAEKASTDPVHITDPTIRRCMQLLQNDSLPPTTVSALTEKLHISRRTLERSFRTFLNTSPAQWIEQQKLYHARHLLLSTPLSVKEIA